MSQLSACRRTHIPKQDTGSSSKFNFIQALYERFGECLDVTVYAQNVDCNCLLYCQGLFIALEGYKYGA